MLRSGGLLLDEDGRYLESIDRSLDDIFKVPHHVGLTRALALCRAGTWDRCSLIKRPTAPSGLANNGCYS